MKVSTRGEYGVRAMVSLAHHYGEGPMSIAEIARQTNIPPAYLEQLIAPLRRAELVVSKRGAHGGYVLSREPESIAVGEVYRVMEGPIAPMDCVSEELTDQNCPLIENCETRPMWLKLRDAMASALDSTTLADLAAKPESGPVHESGEYVTPIEPVVS
ncbi:MAG: Rrf2 family transcriptional regulator [Thermomicrobiales bacterium]|nr:Rrf2 family transcriptional regulator [Thermomicrobiales bacterium]MCO5219114.1 Rrf2 family transcriptional regulator [Thermomicrobiales bacterium]MCO5225420.1 Rrf2 family transcriptional regulator [Thermomicrobiales bacterium]MCO5228762.1 Rrf2 family transcriptional regulator [Thermomicrobiales bacterium]